MEPQELYGLPLERFTGERNALAKALRKEGRRDEATEVSNLRKPSVAAWAVNQLVRTQRRDVSNLFEAGDSLREAQSQLLAGHGEADALRDAVEAERASVEQLTHRARGLLSSEGHELTPATLERVSQTLNAAALDENLRAQVSDGCLVRELHHVGLGGLGASAPSRPGARSKSAPKKRAARPQEEGRERKQTRRPQEKGRERKQTRRPQEEGPERKQTRSAQAAQTRKAEAEARRRAVRTARELKTAQSRRDRAADEFRRTKEALRDAQAAVASAEEIAAGALRDLEELRRARDRG